MYSNRFDILSKTRKLEKYLLLNCRSINKCIQSNELVKVDAFKNENCISNSCQICFLLKLISTTTYHR